MFVILDRDWSRVVRLHSGLCAYCRVAPWEHRDHIIPVLLGGRHSIGNLAPACSPCNTSKGAKVLSVWRGKQILASLPPAQRMTSLVQVQEFYSDLRDSRA